jgi:hypothetical protein
MPGLEVVKPKLYVGCGLTHATEQFKQQVEETKEALGADWDVLKFLGLGYAAPGQVYEQDIITNVGTCDAFVAIVDEPSWGLGYECAKADSRGVPVMLAAHAESKITRLATDTPQWMQNVVFVRYVDMATDVPELVQQHLAPALQPAQ